MILRSMSAPDDAGVREGEGSSARPRGGVHRDTRGPRSVAVGTSEADDRPPPGNRGDRPIKDGVMPISGHRAMLRYFIGRPQGRTLVRPASSLRPYGCTEVEAARRPRVRAERGAGRCISSRSRWRHYRSGGFHATVGKAWKRWLDGPSVVGRQPADDGSPRV